MNELMTRVFENEEFGQVRTIVENGEVLFVAQMWQKHWGMPTLARH